MKVYSEYADGRLTVFLHGELDHHEVKQSMSLIDGLLEQYMPRECLLNLAGLSFMDSSGIALILKLNKRLHDACGRVWVEALSGQPLRVIEASGIERMVQINVAKEAGV